MRGVHVAPPNVYVVCSTHSHPASESCAECLITSIMWFADGLDHDAAEAHPDAAPGRCTSSPGAMLHIHCILIVDQVEYEDIC